MNRALTPLVLLVLAGCPYLGEQRYQDKVRDVDGDGITAIRFGGRDCDDLDPTVGDCDRDRDGVRSVAVGGEDCDDDDARVHPDATETCNGRDDDCDGRVDTDDEGFEPSATAYRDLDGDRYGDPDDAIPWCPQETPPAGFVTDGGDCDDDDDAIHPGARELCDAVDRDCDGDPTAGADDASPLYVDDDGDGYGVGIALGLACVAPPGQALLDGDCDPGDAAVNPGAAEIPYDGIDNDCVDGDLVDMDGDGEAHPAVGGADCDDNEPSVRPGIPESCDGIDQNCDGQIDEGLILPWYPDADADGFGDPLGTVVFACPLAQPPGAVNDASDCDDGLGSVNPAAAEECDGIDNDCDGSIDGPDAVGSVLRYRDADLDGFGDATASVRACVDDLPTGAAWVEDDSDCDDAHGTARPGGVETCDALDNDCNGAIDDGAVDARTYFRDADHDGFGGAPVLACAASEDLSRLPGDCDDDDADTHPGAVEICYDAVRQDCTATPVDDCDGDGASDAVDCEDEDPTVRPGVPEICDGIDNDCANGTDEADPNLDASTRSDWFRDADGDGYGSAIRVATDTCTPPPGSSRTSDDCDDDDDEIWPLAPERCNLLDDDCDGQIDENPADPPAWRIDEDGDGFGDALATVAAVQCASPGEGFAANGDDCHDGFPQVNPGASEVCDGLDNDCDGLLDDADPSADLPRWFVDADLDGYGTPGAVLAQCAQPAGSSEVDTDCDDLDPSRFPGAAEACDGLDNDCDALVDADDPDALTSGPWYLDRDLDGFGDDSTVVTDCVAPPGYVAAGGDCDDDDPRLRPGALELCDGVDNDCDSFVDADDPDAPVVPAWYVDRDDDGWGDARESLRSCSDPSTPALPYSAVPGDCDDTTGAVRPGATEVCDGFDNDCDGLADDDDPSVKATSWYPDADDDGSGLLGSAPAQVSCAAPVVVFSLQTPGFATTNDDCDDDDPAIGPHADEVCDGVDNDCDLAVDDDDPEVVAPTLFTDADGDGWGLLPTVQCPAAGLAARGGDCDDTRGTVYPGAPEAQDGLDNDCDGVTDDDPPLWMTDADGDGAYDVLRPVAAWTAPAGAAPFDPDATHDCDPFDPTVFPGAPELCDGQRNDCQDLPADQGVQRTFFRDADNDGYGHTGDTVTACFAPAGYAAVAGDCLDMPAPSHPGVLPGQVNPGVAVERCNGVDDDCDGDLDEDDAQIVGAITAWADRDGDGFGAGAASLTCALAADQATVAGDCADNDPQRHPEAQETCATPFDDDCDGLVNDSDPSVSDRRLWFLDVDRDTWGRDTDTALACSNPQPAVYVARGGDCDDQVFSTRPDANEQCDAVDNDCDGQVDDGVIYTFYWPDDDGDNRGNPAEEPEFLCAQPAGGWIDNADDCDDTRPFVYLGAPDLCDGFDNDCDGPGVAELDGDGDGWLACAGFVDQGAGLDGGGDCDDQDPTVSPVGTELPGDEVDQDCDGTELCFVDSDFDGDRDGAATQATSTGDTDCDQPGQAPATAPVDCAPADPTRGSGATELVGDEVDQNCDDVELCYVDLDGDGARSTDSVTTAPGDTTCDDPGEALATDPLDCDDADPTGQVDQPWYADCDLDGHPRSVAVMACGESGADLQSPCIDGLPPLGGWSPVPGADCDDEDGGAFPGASEVVDDGVDQNCNGGDACFGDADGDGARSSAEIASADLDCLDPFEARPTDPLDCDDADAGRSPLLAEVVDDGIDQDCSAGDLCWLDADGDGARSSSLTLVSADLDCIDPGEGRESDPLDCNDADPAAQALTSWYADCDADGEASASVVDACGLAGADASTPCSDTFPPDGGWATLGGADCDDEDPGRRPGLAEIVDDGVDQDCSAGDACFVDADEDGARTTQVVASADLDCDDAGEGQLTDPLDCADSNPGRSPLLAEIISDGIDQDCIAGDLCWLDADNDGHRHDTNGIVSADLDCIDANEGRTVDPIDCDDSDPLAQVPTNWFADCDNDGTATSAPVNACGTLGADALTPCSDSLPPDGGWATTGEGDCDDEDPGRRPGLAEIVDDGVDQDCSAGDACFVDADDDGARTFATVSSADLDCADPFEGQLGDPLDCADTNPGRSPLLAEVVDDGIDQDCSAGDLCWLDDDDDGARSSSPTLVSADLDCVDPGEGRTTDPLDCNDADALAQFVAPFYADCDADGVRDILGAPSCGLSGTSVWDTSWCADLMPPDGGWGASPGSDCNDDDPTGQVEQNWFADCDGDFGTRTAPVFACGESGADALTPCQSSLPPVGGWSTLPGLDCNDEDVAVQFVQPWFADCDGDSEPSGLGLPACGLADAMATYDASTCLDGQTPDGGWGVNPGLDCNDEDALAQVEQFWHPDCDGDGVAVNFPLQACGEAGAYADHDPCVDATDPLGWALGGPFDCNDDDPTGSVVESWYADCDGDGFTDGANSALACGEGQALATLYCPPVGPALAADTVASGDCQDQRPAIHPGAAEVCDGFDTNCDTLVPFDEIDDDGDGYLACAGPFIEQDPTDLLVGADDCNDLDVAYFPGQSVTVYSPYGYPTLQEAIDDACSPAFIQLGYGTFPPIVLDDPAKIVQIDGSYADIWSTTGPAVTLDATPPGTELKNLYLVSLDDHALLADSGAVVDLVDVNFFNFESGSPAGIHARSGSDLFCIDCAFSNLTASNGSAIYAEGGASVIVDGGTFQDNVTSNGGTVYSTGATVRLLGSWFSYSEVTNLGQRATAVQSIGGFLELSGVDIWNPVTPDRQPSVLVTGGTAVLTDLRIEGDPSGQGPVVGGLWISGGANVQVARFQASHGIGNPVSANYEGAIEVRDLPSTVDITNAEFYDLNGPAIHIANGSSVGVHYSTVVTNLNVPGIVVKSPFTGLQLDHTVFAGNNSDVSVTSYVPPPTNVANRFQYAISVASRCPAGLTGSDVCTSGAPDFMTWTNPDIFLVFRPFVGGVLWNGAGTMPATADYDRVIGHSGGPLREDFYVDTDSDGLFDGWELYWVGDLVTLSSTTADIDADGFSNADEFLKGTHPLDPNTDGDALNDGVDPFPQDCALPTFACP